MEHSKSFNTTPSPDVPDFWQSHGVIHGSCSGHNLYLYMAPIEDRDGAVCCSVVNVLLYRYRVSDGVMRVYHAFLYRAHLRPNFHPLTDNERR